jgi:hypothetical protein
MDTFQREILETIAAHDGQLSWYQLDRSLSQFSPNRERNLPLLRGLTGALRAMEDDGLIAARAGHHTSQPVYSSTTEGRRVLGGARKGHGVA